MPYLPYKEPGIMTILSLTSFLLLLNGTRYVLDRMFYCGVIGEILIGVLWGLPVGGTALLSEATQETIQAFGYLGLVGLVFEGGLSTDISLLRKNAYASVSVATIGLLMPISFSFLLLLFPFSARGGGTAYPTPLAAFSAGASLCSTSLGTTFVILSAANMQKTRVGIVIVGAAMMDDIIGLVMVNIVTTLGKSRTEGWPIALPIAASFGLLIVNIAVCPYVLRPTWRWLLSKLWGEDQLEAPPVSSSNTWTTISKFVRGTPHLKFVLSTAVLIIFVTIASIIDASALFAAFIAGGVVSFLWAPSDEQQQVETTSYDGGPVNMYEEYLKPAMEFILVPFFFASIGFSIPLTDMFNISIVWKGIVYSILMILGKGMTGAVLYSEYFGKKWKARTSGVQWWRKKKAFRTNSVRTGVDLQLPPETSNATSCPTSELFTSPPHSTALLMGMAMVARGEIGFLIASLSQSSKTLTLRRKETMVNEPAGEEIFLVIIWAVVVCTIVGPLGVGIIVKRIRALSP